VTRDFCLSSVLFRMGEAGRSGYEIGAVLTCYSPSLAMNYPLWICSACGRLCRNSGTGEQSVPLDGGVGVSAV